MPGYPTIFLDRDGVIIENRSNYVRDWADVSFLPGAMEALRRISSSRYRIVIITNQSAIGRGILASSTAEAINARIVEKINMDGGRIDSLQMCPHAPQDNCKCRKPLPGMILRARDELDLNLSLSFLIGDSITDLQAGEAAGIPNLSLVRTGLGASHEEIAAKSIRSPYLVFDDIMQAIRDLPLKI